MPNILLVEELEMCRDMLPRRLKRKGFNIAVAREGSEVIKMAQSEYPDLILNNMDLAVKNGQTAIKELKADDATKSIPIIALTRYESDIEQAYAVGCDDYEPVPIELPRLLEKIHKWLSTRDNK
ncbi:MAG TPA: response regulator [Thiotrichaceae bacterium]|nr:response regulator [Thiotrichaceae bacterium]